MPPPTILTGNEPLPVRSVTPLYDFSTDVEPLVIMDDVEITRATDEHLRVFSSEDVFVQHVRLYQPQHLLWKTTYLTADQLALILGLTDSSDADPWRAASESPPWLANVIEPVADLLRVLHLFKPGRLVAGDTSFFVQTGETGCGTMSLVRCSEMSVDFHSVKQLSPHYEFNAGDIPFFLSFMVHLYEVWLKALKYPQIDLAMYRYARESSLYGEAVELMISLEALLVPEEEGIAFRLAQRVANLLGGDAKIRKEIFREIRDFYSVRSKIVHGAKFKRKEFDTVQKLDWLREITRRVLLSVMALAADVGLEPDLYVALNDMCFDDELRRSLQSKAARLLHC